MSLPSKGQIYSRSSYDIEAELQTVKHAKLKGNLAAEEKQREEKLLKDLEFVKLQIGQEIVDIERELL